MFGVELVTDEDSKTPLEIEKVECIVRSCKESGLMTRNLESVITFVPVLSMSNKEVKAMVRIFKEAVHNILDRKC